MMTSSPSRRMKKWRVPSIALLSAILMISGGGTAQACTNPAGVAGDQIYNADFAVMQYCDGTDWTAMRGGVAADSIDWDDIVDAMTLDASTSITADGTEVLSIVNTGTGNSLLIEDEAADTTPFIIDADGNVGIGKTTANTLLDIEGAAANGSYIATLKNSTAGGELLQMLNTNDNEIFSFNADGGPGTQPFFRLTNDAGNRELTLGFESNSFRIDSLNNSGTASDLLLYAAAGADQIVLKTDGNVGMGTAAPDASSLLDLSSTDQGFLAPRVSNPSVAIATPATGLIAYNTVTDLYQFYDGTSWVNFGASGGVTELNDLSDAETTWGGATIGTSGTGSMAIGEGAAGNASGAFNGSLAVGYQAAQNNTSAAASVYIGNWAGRNAGGSATTYVGVEAGRDSPGYHGVAVGTYSGLQSNNDFTAVGWSALRYNTASRNTALGSGALTGVSGSSTGGTNVAVGFNAGTGVTTGSANTLLGHQAGNIITTGARNIMIGIDTDPSAATASDELNIGDLLFADMANNIFNINSSDFSDPAGAWTNPGFKYVNNDDIWVMTYSNAATTKADLNFMKAGGTEAAPTAISNGSTIAEIRWSGYDGDEFLDGSASIYAQVSGAVADNIVPVDLVIGTGSNGDTERMRIDTAGNIGVGTLGAADPSALMEIESTNKGFLAPRVSDPTSAIAAPATGLIAYNTVTDLYEFYNGTSWVNFNAGGGGGGFINDLGDAATDYVTDFNMFMGQGAGASILAGGSNNVGLGQRALEALTTGDDNVAIGHEALGNATTSYESIAIGHNTLQNSNANANVAVGYQSMFSNTTGGNNIAVGPLALFGNEAGFQNIVIGYSAGSGTGAGDWSENVFIGNDSANNVAGGAAENTAIGDNTFSLLTTGDRNIALGAAAGNAITTGSDNILIGYDVDATSATASNELNIGDLIYGDLAAGNVGIGTATPASELQVIGDIQVSNFVKFDGVAGNAPTYDMPAMVLNDLTDTSVAAPSNNDVLTWNGTNWVAQAASGGGLWTDLTGGRIHYGTTAANQIGVGTNNPGYTLDVNGDINLPLGSTVRAGGDSMIRMIAPNDASSANSIVIGTNVPHTNLGAGTGYNQFEGPSVFIGDNAGRDIDTTGGGRLEHVFIGARAGQNITSGNIGSTLIGAFAGDGTPGFSVTAIGRGAGKSAGALSTYVGYDAGGQSAIATGQSNVGIGLQAGEDASGAENVYIGTQAGMEQRGQYNTALGYQALLGVDTTSTGVNNIAVGWRAGDSITTGTDNILLGYDVDASAATASNELNIGGALFGNLTNNQIAINVTDASAIDADAILQADSTNRGFLAPRISNPAVTIGATTAGMMAYDTVNNLYQFYDGSSWQDIGAGAGGAVNAIDDLSDAATDYATDFNMFMGQGAGASIAAGGQENLAIGQNAGDAIASGDGNIVIGYDSGTNITTGLRNTALGVRSGVNITTGSENTFIGEGAGLWGPNGTRNTALGQAAMAGSGGNNNTAIGRLALNGASVGSVTTNNTALGFGAGSQINGGSNNLFLGYQAGDLTSSGTDNILIGYDVDATSATASNELNIGGALFGNLTNNQIAINVTDASAIQATAILQADSADRGFLPPRMSDPDGDITGEVAGLVAYDTTDNELQFYDGTSWVAAGGGGGAINDLSDAEKDVNNLFMGEVYGSPLTNAHSNTSIGIRALDSLTDVAAPVNAGDNNTAFGFEALTNLETGQRNTAIGRNTLSMYVTGYDNTALGSNALRFANGGNNNTALGSGAGENQVNSNSNNNTFVGTAAGFGTPNGENISNNTVIGYSAGRFLDTNASNNILLGYQAGNVITTGSNNIILGYDIDPTSATASNELNIGDLIYGDLAAGNVGIGTATPGSELQVIGDVQVSNFVKYDGVAGNTPTYAIPAMVLNDLTDTSVVAPSNNDVLTWNGTNWIASAATIPADSIDWDDMADAMTLDATTTIDMDTNAANFNFDANTFVIDSANNRIGIGTNTPAVPLHLVSNLNSGADIITSNLNTGAAASADFFAATNGGGLTLGVGSTANNSGGSYLFANGVGGLTITSYHAASGGLFFETGPASTERMRIQADGDIGIGTLGVPEASAIVEIDSASKGFLAPRVSDPTSAIATPATGLMAYNTVTNLYQYYDGTAWRDFGYGVGASVDEIADADNDTKIQVEESADEDIIRFDTAGIERMVISPTGEIGIGTATPGADLHISRLGGALGLTDTDSFSDPLDFMAWDAGNNNLQLRWNDNSASTYNALVTFASGGNMGIGTTTPASELQVVGDVQVSNFVKFDGVAGNVPTYNIPSLALNDLTDTSVAAPSNNDVLTWNGTNWIAQAGGGGGGAINDLSDGATDYVTDFNLFMGQNAGASIAAGGRYNLAIGEDAGTAITTGDENTLIGYQAGDLITTGPWNTAIGSFALSSSNGLGNTALGRRAGQNSTGGSNVFIGERSGSSTSGETGNNTFVGAETGLNNTTGSNNTFVGFMAGLNNETGSGNIFIAAGNTTVDGTSISASDELNIGNTIFGDLANNYVGIGTAAPAYLLDVGTAATMRMTVNNNVNTADDPYSLGMDSATSNANRRITFATEEGTNRHAMQFGDGAAARTVFGLAWSNDSGVTYNPGFVMQGNGEVGIGTSTPDVELDVIGDIEYTGTLTDVSDRRLKTDIETLSTEAMIEKIAAIDTYSFKMKDDAKGRTEMGVMAQELEVIFPELVKTADDEMGTKSVNYMGLIAPMIEATKALKAQNDSLTLEMASLQNDRAQTQASLESLNKQVTLLNKAYLQNNMKEASFAQGFNKQNIWMLFLLGFIGGGFFMWSVNRRPLRKS